ncbi:MAG: bacillithiol biosynthesis deacetylase BshB1 [Bacillota bacterium]
MILHGDGQQTLDVLAFGPHPDDAEIGLAGTLCRLTREGRAVGVADLTRGELSSNGTVEDRLNESRAAASIMGIAVRENLELHDGALDNSARTLRPIIEAIRRYRPRVVCLPHWEDRHPDHIAASRLLTEAAYRAGLAKWPAGGEPYRPERVVYYFINGNAQPSFVIATSAYFEQKMEALRAHGSQFNRTAAGAATPINDPRYFEMIEARDRYFGSLVGERYAEGFIYQGVIALPSLATL